MKNLHQYLQLALLGYFGIFLIFFIAFEPLGGLFGMDEITSDFLVKIILIGLILFLVSWGVGISVRNSQATAMKKMEHEMNALKAKIYDFEHPKTAPIPQDSTKKEIESDPSTLPPRQNIT